MTDIQNKKTTILRFKGVEWIFMNLPFVCFLALLGVLYISNAHMAEKRLRKIEALKSEVKDVEWQYMNLKQDIMYGSTQSQLEKKVAESGLESGKTIPKKIKDKGS